MPYVTYDVDRYWILHFNAEFADRTALIYLYPPDSMLPCAYLHFYREAISPIPPSSQLASGRISLRFPASQLGDVMETLRRDKPLKVMFNTTYHTGSLTTAREPIGEEEPE